MGFQVYLLCLMFRFSYAFPFILRWGAVVTLRACFFTPQHTSRECSWLRQLGLKAMMVISFLRTAMVLMIWMYTSLGQWNLCFILEYSGTVNQWHFIPYVTICIVMVWLLRIRAAYWTKTSDHGDITDADVGRESLTFSQTSRTKKLFPPHHEYYRCTIANMQGASMNRSLILGLWL